MKKIEVIVRPEKVDAVRKALDGVGYPGVTVAEVQGHGKQKGVTRQWRGESYTVDFLPKVKLEIVANDPEVEAIVQAISKAAKTGEVGDGKIFITDIKDVIRIRTGERGQGAI